MTFISGIYMRYLHMSIKRIRLTVAYDGTAYHGWQLQPGVTTIESELNRCLTGLLGTPIEVIGASRTDAGVHALGNIAVFDTDTPIPGEKIAYALNSRLPADICIRCSEEVPLDWHPRRCASRKTYEYHLYCADFPIPTKRLHAHYLRQKPDLTSMQKALPYFLGEHDFQSFCQSHTQALSTTRTIYQAELESHEDPQTHGQDIFLRICGNGFLYNMIRIITGTLLEIGLSRMNPYDIPRILEARDRRFAGPTAPAKGLTLTHYEFI
jgi:tRNA pseudouridine38-40 synthase